MSDAARGSRTSVKVEIAGEQYSLITDADEEYTRRCAALVDERMRQIADAGNLDTRKTAILAALSLSDELFRQQTRVGDRARALTGLIENALGD